MTESRRGLEGVADELRDLLEALRLALGADRGCVWTLSDDADRLSAEVCAPGDAEGLFEDVRLKGHALGWVVSEGVSLRASREDIFWPASEGWLVAAPIVEPRGERVGCVVMEFEREPGLEVPRVLELAGKLAGRLIGDARTVEGTLGDLLKYEALYGAFYDLDRELNLQQLARGACQRARQVSGARGAVVAAWDSGTGTGCIIGADGDVPAGLVDARLDAGSSFLGLALSNGTALPRDDLRGKEKFPLYVAGVDSDAGSAIIMPMTADAELIGALAVEYARAREFGGGDVQRLQALARFVAPAFRNAIAFGEIKALSLTDPLTELANRRSTERTLAMTIAAAEGGGGPFAVAVLDVDHFKRVNDSYGHDAGDRVLQVVAALIREELRPGDHAGRWGGEEFLVVLPATSLEDAARVVERIRRSVERTEIVWEGHAVRVTLSAGVSAYPETTPSGAGAVPSADAALYRAKRAGRNVVALAEALGEA